MTPPTAVLDDADVVAGTAGEGNEYDILLSPSPSSEEEASLVEEGIEVDEDDGIFGCTRTRHGRAGSQPSWLPTMMARLQGRRRNNRNHHHRRQEGTSGKLTRLGLMVAMMAVLATVGRVYVVWNDEASPDRNDENDGRNAAPAAVPDEQDGNDYHLSRSSQHDNATCDNPELTERLWPLPRNVTKGKWNRTVFSGLALMIADDVSNPTLESAFEWYRKLMFPLAAEGGSLKEEMDSDDNDDDALESDAADPKEEREEESRVKLLGMPTSGGVLPLGSVRVSVQDWSEDPPQLHTKEDYELTIYSVTDLKAPHYIDIRASTIYGAMHAFQTLSQLVTFDYDTERYVIHGCPLHIRDEPRFPHRGIMIDTGRHFLPLPHIRSLLDSMMSAKLNVLHWHLVDLQSFPLQSIVYPELWNGAFSPHERYRQVDIAGIVEYARQRGIRVVPELDVPGHAASWCVGRPDICPSTDCLMPLDVSNEDTFHVLESLMMELTGGDGGEQNRGALFPDGMFHLGGDEVNTDCWKNVSRISDWLDEKNMTLDDGYKYFVDRAATIARKLGRRPVQWVEVFEHFRDKLDDQTIVHIWKGKDSLKEVVASGYDALLSNGHDVYLDHLKTPWEQLYLDDPHENITDVNHQRRVLGGQSEMWGETVDGSNMLQTIWPRAAAYAERLWSDRSVNSTACAGPRLTWFRCLLLSRGVPAAPVFNDEARTAPTGPGSCFV